MATDEIASFCNICLARDQNKLAKEYCPQCEEALCGDCVHHHKISKSTKSHQTISLEKYNKLPSFIKQIKHNCEEHDCFLECYCKSHDSLCCKRCLISGHKECKETIFIEDFPTPSTGYHPVALHNIEKAVKDLDTNICFAIKDRKRNLTDLLEQKQKILEQIKKKRKEINTVLDNLEGVLIDKVSAIEKEYGRKIEEVIAKLEDEKKKVDEIIEDVDSVKMFASNLQIFMGTKTFQEKVLSNEMNVQKLYDNGNLNNFTMQCTFNDKMEGFIKEIKTFGDIEIDSREKHSSFSWTGDKSSQITKSTVSETLIENIHLMLERKFDICRSGLTGCAMSEAGNMLFLQAHANNLLRYGANGQFKSESRINSKYFQIGYDLTVIDSNTVFVSSGGYSPQQIYLMEIDSARPRQVFKLDDFCCGLSYQNELFICCSYYHGIKIYDRSHQQLTYNRTLNNAPSDVHDTYVTSNENFIFHSNWCDNSIVCYDFSGLVQWKYSDSLLRKPYGITLDSFSNIYVAGSESNNIVVISPDGKQGREVIGPTDGMVNPRAIYFDKNKSMLLIASYNGVAFLYNATYNI
ncbi:Hypothetical predicted protein [Mytilus galloprovincialis]|uniref:B box-type domain-containing protein n=1 Tax=Mytilus galloprovincialis TaxID=29158 RepID=A0A8B6FSM4_MYTGA|nr:Hypothetical predicted protein [Mytilus galloprovincialis]